MRTIVFVDDESRVLTALRRTLHGMRESWEMRFVTTAEEALTVLETDDVDVVVSDLRMPGMDGTTFLETVLERYPTAIRIVLSGHAEMSQSAHLVGLAHRVVMKPCDSKALMRAVTDACALRDSLHSPSLSALISTIKSLPTFPDLYQQVTEEVRSPRGSLQRVGEIVAQDAGMAAKVLQVVNSSYFALREPVSDPVRATIFLGVDKVSALILSASIFEAADLQIAGLSTEELWETSLETAAMAKAIATAEQADRRLIEQAYAAGLLHEAGTLILATHLGAKYAQIRAQAAAKDMAVWEVEAKRLGTGHAEIGAALLGIWGLPDAIVEAVAFHHRPSECPCTDSLTLLAVHAAQALRESRSRRRPAEFDTKFLDHMGATSRVETWQTALQAA
jgi:HD-like signal output (HDOD) protein